MTYDDVLSYSKARSEFYGIKTWLEPGTRKTSSERKKKETTYITGFINSRSKLYAIDAVLADMLLSPLQNYGVHRATPAS